MLYVLYVLYRKYPVGQLLPLSGLPIDPLASAMHSTVPCLVSAFVPLSKFPLLWTLLARPTAPVGEMAKSSPSAQSSHFRTPNLAKPSSSCCATPSQPCLSLYFRLLVHHVQYSRFPRTMRASWLGLLSLVISFSRPKHATFSC